VRYTGWLRSCGTDGLRASSGTGGGDVAVSGERSELTSAGLQGRPAGGGTPIHVYPFGELSYIAGEVPIIRFVCYLICLVSLTMAVPSIVIAQSNTAFDGTYAGVSNTQTGGVSGCDPFGPTPRTLTVRNGTAQYWGGSLDYFQGEISSQGDFRMSDMFANIITGKIDASGKATGSSSFGNSGCAFTVIWQRQ